MNITPSVDERAVRSAESLVLELPPPPSGAWLTRLVSLGLAASLLVGVLLLAHLTGWRMPKFSALMGWQNTAPDDWCQEHSVPESTCVECIAARSGKKPNGFGWCKEHGVHDCPLCHPEVAQLTGTTPDTARLAEQFAAAEGVADRVGNNRKCKLHERRLQFASADDARLAGVRVEAVATAPIVEAVHALAEVVHDPTAVARVSARLPGTARQVLKNQGDRVRRGDVLALVDAPGVGKARAALAQARLRVEAETKAVAALRAIAATVPERRVREAQAALDEAVIQVAAAELALANLGLADDGQGGGSVLPVVAPRDGVIVRRDVAPGEAVEAGAALFVLAEPDRLWLMLHVRHEDARSLRLGQAVRFAAEGKAAGDGAVEWIGKAIDERTRTVPVRATLRPGGGDLRAGLFGRGLVVLREAASAVVVPGEAVHWEGCCHVVFVRDKAYDDPDAAKVFHVRTVQPGGADAGRKEILAGLLPGEVVATGGSGLLRSELLRNNLGAG